MVLGWATWAAKARAANHPSQQTRPAMQVPGSGADNRPGRGGGRVGLGGGSGGGLGGGGGKVLGGGGGGGLDRGGWGGRVGRYVGEQEGGWLRATG